MYLTTFQESTKCLERTIARMDDEKVDYAAGMIVWISVCGQDIF